MLNERTDMGLPLAVIELLARVGSIASITLLVLIFMGDAFRPSEISRNEWIGLAFFPIGVVLGMVILVTANLFVSVRIEHPLDAGLRGIYGTIFTGPATSERADLRNVTIFADAEVDRSPCGTGTCAVMAVIDAMGLLADDKPFVHESLIGTRFQGRVASRTLVGEHQAIVPSIEGSAWITGEHTFIVDDYDPLKDGFRI